MKPDETISVREFDRQQVPARIKERDGYVCHRTSNLVSDNAGYHPVLFEHVLAHDSLGVRQRTGADREGVRGVVGDHNLTGTRISSVITTPPERRTLKAIVQMDRYVDHS